MLPGERVVAAHARIFRDAHGEFVLADLGSRHGTQLNGEPFRDGERALQSGDAISIDGEVLRFLSGAETRSRRASCPLLETQSCGSRASA